MSGASFKLGLFGLKSFNKKIFELVLFNQMRLTFERTKGQTEADRQGNC
jgi:hypothetical protein